MRRFLLVVITLIALVFITSPVYAAGIVVNTSADDNVVNGNCTLREAIMAANTDAPVDGCSTGSGPDVITFDNNTTITLSSELPVITTPVTITGNGAASTIIQAAAAPNAATSRVFEIGVAGSLTLNNLTVRNGVCNGSCAAPADSGGGIYNAGDLTLNSSAVSASTASTGGGIYNIAALNILKGSLIGGAGAGNTANSGSRRGAGVYNTAAGTVIVDASTISANTAVFPDGTNVSYGGGILNEGTLTIRNGSLIGGAGAGNQADWGSGVYNHTGGTLNVVDSSITGNLGTYGGGIENDGGSTTVSASSISGNSAGAFGGGIDNYGTLTIQNHTLIGGVGAGNSGGHGGGLYSHYGASATVDASTFSANTANSVFGDGGGIFNDTHATLTIQNGSLIGGVGAGNSAANGGGIFNNSSITLTVDASRIIGNTATDSGGGIFNSGPLTIQNGSIIAANAGTTNGGGLYNSLAGSSTVTVTGTCIAGNSTTAFLNTNSASQTATGDWWGSPGGPGTPGADTVDGPWDVSGWLKAAPPACLTGKPGQPKITTPAATLLTNDSTPTFGWTAAANAATYHLQISASSTFKTVKQDVPGLSGLSYTASTLADRVYYVRVEAVNFLGTAGKWSAVRKITVDATPPKVPAFKATITTSIEPTLQAVKSVGAVSYEFQVSTDSGFAAGTVLVDVKAKSPSYKLKPAQKLQHHVQYYWRIRAFDKAGNASAWSIGWGFTIHNDPAS